MMKVLKTPAMKKLLQKGKRKARREGAPSEGMFLSLYNFTICNGWHYQIEYVYDLRMHNKPFVVVYAWRPPVAYSAISADYCLRDFD